MTSQEFSSKPMFERGEALQWLQDRELADFAFDFDPSYLDETNGLAAQLWSEIAKEQARRMIYWLSRDAERERLEATR